MWVDDSGATDTTGPAGTDEMTVHVDGADYTADVNMDIDEDGVDDTVVMDTEQGGARAFVDVDHDGQADELIEVDAQGQLVTHAQFDSATGDWVAVPGGPEGQEPTDTTDTGTSGGMTVDLPDGEVALGPATVDTDNDGTNDTVMIQDGSGQTIASTDADGDGNADIAVVMDASGATSVYEHVGDGEWAEDPSGDSMVGAQGAPSAVGDEAWGGSQHAVEGVAKIDSATGQWISPN